MSIVTNFNAVPSRLFSVYAAVADAENGQLREQLEAWATPPSLSTRGGNDEEGGSSALFTNALSEIRRLGLVEEDGDRVRVPTVARAPGGRGNVIDYQLEFLDRVRAVLFDPDRAVDVGQAGFLHALAWLLTRSPLEPLSFSTDPQNLLRDDLGSSASLARLSSTASYQNLVYWARYLGFATILGGGGSGRVFPDPSKAIAAVVQRILPDADWVDIDTFLSRLAAIYPVLEGGSVREEVEAVRTAPLPADDRLSIASSLALQRLADRNVIVLDAVADAKAKSLDFGGVTKRVSRLRREPSA